MPPTFTPTSTQPLPTASIPNPAPTQAYTATATVSPPAPTPIIRETITPVSSKQPGNIQLRLVQLKMFKDQSGWSIDLNGRVLYTKNSGKSWKDVSPGQAPQTEKDAQPIIPAAYFLNSSTAWLVYLRYDQPLLLLHTTNSGSNWIEAAPLPEIDDSARLAPISIQFIDEKNGWLWTQIYPGMHHVYPLLFKTVDGGRNWKLIYKISPGEALPETTLHGSYSQPFGDQIFGFFNSQRGIAGTGILQITSDSGGKWQTILPPPFTGQPVVKNPYVYVCAPVMKNEVAAVQVLTYEFEHVYNPPGDQFDDIPKAAYLAWTEDSGKNWTARKAPALIGTLSMFDVQHTWFLGKSVADPKAPMQLFISPDQGKSWNLVAGNSDLPLGSEINWVEAQTGYAIPPSGSRKEHFTHFDLRFPQPGSLYKTENGGQTWREIFLELE